jgi:hypothetical protein
MHRFAGNDIELTAGDSLFFNVNFDGRNLPDGAVAVFTVKRNPKDEEAVIEKELLVEDNAVRIHLVSTDTAELQARTYYWDLRLKFDGEEGEEVETPMEYAALTILQPVGEIGG